MEVVIIIVILIVIDYYYYKQPSPKSVSDIKKLLAELPSSSSSSSFSSASEIDSDKYTTEQFIMFKHNYLQSQKWKDKRSLVIQRDKCCQLCGATSRLEVHHLSYRALTEEPLDHLVKYCKP